MKTIIVRLLLLFYLTSAYLSATHIHHEALESVDCKVCIVVKNLNSVDTPSSSLELLGCKICFEKIAVELSYASSQPLKGYNAQAPPYFF